MRYQNVRAAKFIDRPNRFIAMWSWTAAWRPSM